jgi:uncharacterized protein
MKKIIALTLCLATSNSLHAQQTKSDSIRISKSVNTLSGIGKFSETIVSFELNDITLHGTLTLPEKSKKRIPVVLIIAGSGATDRNGNNVSAGLNCDSYKQLAYALAVNNIASLRYDKRGVGQSKPTTQSRGPRVFEPEVSDAKSLVDYLRKDKKFSKIIIAAHSQGALVGMLASEQATKFISLSGVGLPGAETLR